MGASFKGFKFRFGIKLLNDEADHRMVEHEYPGVNGALVENLGRKLRTFEIETVFPATGFGGLDYLKLLDLADEIVPGHLILPGRPRALCFLKTIATVEREGGAGLKDVRLTFWETLDKNAALRPAPTGADVILTADDECGHAAAILKESTPLEKMKAVYASALAAIDAARQKIAVVTSALREIRQGVQRPFNELSRLAIDIETVANEIHGLARDLAKYPTLPFTVVRRLQNAGNTLTLIGRTFTAPPKSSDGAPLTNHMAGPVITHTVKPGDTLESICVEYYGSTEEVSCLAEWNGLRSHRLRIGDVLVIPPFKGKTPVPPAPVIPKVDVAVQC